MPRAVRSKVLRHLSNLVVPSPGASSCFLRENLVHKEDIIVGAVALRP